MKQPRSALIYDKIVQEKGLGENHHLVIALVGRHRKVLEVGPAGGYVTRVLVGDLDCTVHAVEIDPTAAASAQRHAHKTLIGSIEDQRILDHLDTDYDVAIFGDVLEHLVDPWQVLRVVSDKLKPGGRVLASIPNVAHWTVRLGLLMGHFDYFETGLLDQTHLRFFTLSTVTRLFEEAGYHSMNISPTRGPIPFERYIPSEKVKRALVRRFPELLGFQFVVEAQRT